MSATKMDSTMLTKVLRNLERCDFVIRYSQFGNKKRGVSFGWWISTLFFTTVFWKNSTLKMSSGGVTISNPTQLNPGKDWHLNSCVSCT